MIPAFLCKEPYNPHINSITKERSSKSIICVFVAYGRWEKYLNTLDGGWMSDSSFEKTNLHRVLFCPAKSPSSQKALVWKRKLPGSSKGISWFPAGNSRRPRYHAAALCICWFPQRHGLGCSPLRLFQREKDSIIFMPDAHGHARSSPCTAKCAFPSHLSLQSL